MNDELNICSVCNEPVEPHTDSICGLCGLTFHLNQREDLPGKDCGQVWINEEHLGLEFGCQTCLDKSAPQQQESTGAAAGSLDDILDLAEAAAALGVPEDDLRAWTDRGDVPHRKTSSGTLLFERRALSGLEGLPGE